MAARERTGLRGDLNGGYNVQPRAIRRDEFPTSALGSLEAPSLRMTYANHAQRGVAPRPRSPSFFFSSLSSDIRPSLEKDRLEISRRMRG